MHVAKQVGCAVAESIARVACVIAITLALIGSPSAKAQGTSGTLPDPMSTRELNEYADRLGLSDQQRIAMSEMHDQYKAEFKTLRDGEIAAFLKELRTMQGNTMPKREQIKQFVDKMSRLNAKIASIDGRLFDQLQTILTPDQQSKLPRVRQARQRARYSASQMMMMSGAPIVDLSGIMHDLHLPPDQVIAADPVLSQYETKLTSSMGKLYESSGNMFLDMFEALEKAGFADVDVNDQEVLGKMMEAMQKIWQDIMQKSLEASLEIHALNRRTAKTISTALAPEHARNFRSMFFRQGYPELRFVHGSNGQTFIEALKLPDLSPEQRQQIESTQTEFHGKLDRLIEETADVVDEARKNFSPWSTGTEDGDARQKVIAEAGKKAQEINQSALTALTSTLGPEQLKQVQSAAMQAMQKTFASSRQHVLVDSSDDFDDADDDEDWEIDEEEDADDADDIEEVQAMAFSGDAFLPGRINQRDLNAYATKLKLADEQRPVLDQLHREYSEKYQEIQNTDIGALNQAQQSMWKYDEATQTSSGPTPELIERAYKLRVAAMEKIAQADQSFFDDVEAALLNPEQAHLMAGVRLARERQRYAAVQHGWMMWGGGETNESGIDLNALLQRRQLDAATLQAIDSILADYDKSATPIFAKRYQAALNLQRAQEQWQAESYAASRSEGGYAALSLRFTEIMGEASRASSQVNAELAQVNRKTLESLTAALPDDAAYELRSEFNRLAFPNIHNDPGALDRKLNQALKLETLTTDQRQRLSDLAAEYRPAYAAFCEQMIAASSGSEGINMFGGDPEAVEKWQDREEAMAKLRFDRDELNSRAAQKLKSILNSEQLAQIGGLPTPPE
jgi:hypothetical protein